MKKRNILYVFRSNRYVLEDYSDQPDEFSYGMAFLKKMDDICVDFICKTEKIAVWQPATFVLERYVSKKTRLGFYIDIFLKNFRKIEKSDDLVCTTDGCGLGLLFWKKMGFLKNEDIHFICQSLPDRVEYFSQNRRLKKFYRALLNLSKKIYTLSEVEKEKLVKDFDIERNKVIVNYFGVDINFWKPLSTNRENFILSVGNDMYRDYDLLVKSFPKDLKLKIITRKEIDLRNNGNIAVSTGYTDGELREIYNKSLFIIVPSKRAFTTTGLSVTLQAMACGKAVILSKNIPFEEMFEHEKHCFFVEPENETGLKDAILYLCNNPELCYDIGNNARKLVEQKFNSENYAENLFKHILD